MDITFIHINHINLYLAPAFETNMKIFGSFDFFGTILAEVCSLKLTVLRLEINIGIYSYSFISKIIELTIVCQFNYFISFVLTLSKRNNTDSTALTILSAIYIISGRPR